MIATRKNLMRLLAALGFVAFASAAAAAPTPGILIEAENPARKGGESKGFLKPARDVAASGETSVMRFYMPGNWAEYDFEIEKPGLYRVWLRYGTNDEVAFQAGVAPKGEAIDMAPVKATATGGYVGWGVWKWVRLLEARLEPGPHTLRMTSVSMRPDCFFVTTAEGEPQGVTPEPIEPDPLTPEEKKLIDKPYPPVVPEWIDEEADYRLPAWFDDWRAHIHTRLWTEKEDMIESPIFLTAAKGFASVGARVYSRHIKSGPGGPLWPTEYGEPNELLKGRNLTQQIIDNAHAENCRVIGYYWHMAEESVAQAHPDWICRDPRGDPIIGARGTWMCLNSPWTEFVEKRLLEAVDMGVDGIYFDYLHMPQGGCWCEYCQKRFKEETGLRFPKTNIPEEPRWEKLVAFNNLTIERAFLRWRRAIHGRNPECVMCMSSSGYAGLSWEHMTTRFFRIMDTNKTEFTHPLRPVRLLANNKKLRSPEPAIQQALGWTVCRDGADGRPPHIWLAHMIDETEMLYAAAGMVTHGNIANIDMNENRIPDPIFVKTFDLMNRVSPAFRRVKPMRWAAVHYSEIGRRPYLAEGSVKLWAGYTAKVFGAFKALLRDRLPVGIITDSQLEQGLTEGYQVIFLPTPDRLTDGMKASLAAFEKRGGRIIRQQPDWNWASADTHDKTVGRFLATQIAPVSSSAPVQVIGGPEVMHAVPFRSEDGKRVVVALCNDYGWVRSGGYIREAPMNPVPPPIGDAVVILRLDEKPAKIYEAATGKTLEAKTSPRGLEVAVPAFEAMAVVVAEF